MKKTAIEYYNHIKGDQEYDIRVYDKYQVIRLMERYLQSELKNHGDIGHVSDCILFATWLQDNYSTNVKQGSNIPLGKGRWREDFSDTIYSVEVLWDKWWNDR